MDQELDILKNIFGSTDQPIELIPFFLQLILTTVLTLVIGFFYIRFGKALSNRKALANVLVLVGLTTMVIITIVKSSLALSLGLVGALSIVRFRTAIKEPEELAYFFMAIAIGLGVGAGQVLVTVIATAFLCALIMLTNKRASSDLRQNLIIRITNPESINTEKLINIIKEHSAALELRRLDEQPDYAELSFNVGFNDYKQLLNTKDKLRTSHPELSFSFMEVI